MKSILTVLLTLTFNVGIAQDVIIGETSKEELNNTEYADWYQKGYSDYDLNKDELKKLKKLFRKNDYQIEVYFGSWCIDSKREVPKLVKLLDLSGFNFENLSLVGVGRDKVVPGASEEELKKLNITNVPTIIIKENDKELNRFVEFPQETLEADLIKILSKQDYKHSYQF